MRRGATRLGVGAYVGAVGVLILMVSLIPVAGLRRARSCCRRSRSACEVARRRATQVCARSRSDPEGRWPRIRQRRGGPWSSGSSGNAGSRTSACSRRWRRVPRELFVPEGMRDLAYEDGALPIGSGQTISQPFIVAAICSLLELRGDEHVLDVGTGSGYQAAVLAELAREVTTIERVPELYERARAAARRRRATPTSTSASETARSVCPRRRRSTRSPSRPRRRRCPMRSTTSSSRAAGSSSRAARAGARTSSRSSRHRTARSERASIPCRFVPLVGAGGFRRG